MRVGKITSKVLQTLLTCLVVGSTLGWFPSSVHASSTTSPIISQPLSSPAGGTWEATDKIPLSGTERPLQIAISGGKAYVSRNPGHLTVVDLSTNMVVTTIGFDPYPGAAPHYIAISGSKAYVALGNLGSDGQLAVVNIADNTVSAYIPVGADPYGVATLDQKVYVTNNVWWSNGDPATVKVVDANTNSVVASTPVGINPTSIAIDPVNGKAYVTNRNDLSKSVSVIDTNTNSVTATIPINNPPAGVAISGNRAYIATTVNMPYGTVEVIDIGSDTVVSSIPIGRDSWGIAALDDYVFVANQSSSTVSVIELATNSVVATVNVGDDPTHIAVDPSTSKVYVSNQGDNTISIIEFTETSQPTNQPPTVSITTPSNNADVSGIVNVQGTASDPDGNDQLEKVEVKIDTGNWVPASGTTSWSYFWDTTTIPDGQHSIYARSYDGQAYSSETSVVVTVSTQAVAPSIIDVGITAETILPLETFLQANPGDRFVAWYDIAYSGPRITVKLRTIIIDPSGKELQDSLGDPSLVLMEDMPGHTGWVGDDFQIPNTATIGTYSVRFSVWSEDGAQEYDALVKSGWLSLALDEQAETITAPNPPSGPSSGEIDQSLTYTTGGSSSSLGHLVEYRFDWGDGTYSNWSSSTTASHSWSTQGSYTIRARAQCASHTDVPSPWSSGLAVSINPVPFPTIAFSPLSLSFTVTEESSNPASQTLQIWNSGGGTLSWSVSDDAPWLTLSPTSGSSTREKDNVAVSASIPGMSSGSYTATITISDSKASNTPQTVPVSLSINPPQETVSTRTDFIAFAAPLAQESQQDSGVPSSVTIAQAALESGWGTSRLAQELNNYFGIKCAGLPKPQRCEGEWRAYETARESFIDHGQFLRQNPRYHEAFDYIRDPIKFAMLLAEAGYAEDPDYFNKLKSIMDSYDLYQHDVFLEESFPGERATTLWEYYSAWGRSLPPLSERAKMYEAMGLGSATNYAGTAEQNTRLLNALKQRQICPSTADELGEVVPPTTIAQLIEQEAQERTPIIVDGEEYYVVTLKRYIEPEKLQPFAEPSGWKVYVDSTGEPVSDEDIVRRISLVKKANYIMSSIGSPVGISDTLQMIDEVLAAHEDLTNAEMVAFIAQQLASITVDVAIVAGTGGAATQIIFDEIRSIVLDFGERYTNPVRLRADLGGGLLDAAKGEYKEADRISRVQWVVNLRIDESGDLTLEQENFTRLTDAQRASEFLEHFYTAYLMEVYGTGLVLPDERINKNTFYEILGWVPEYIGDKISGNILSIFQLGKNLMEYPSSLEEYLRRINSVSSQVEELMAEPGRSAQYTLALAHQDISFLKELPLEPYIYAHVASPVELRVRDSKERTTGVIDGEVRIDIPRSYYSGGAVIIFSPSDSYEYEVTGTGEGSYDLAVTTVAEEINTFIREKEPTSAKAVHQYTIDWEVLSTGKKGVTMKIDADGDGTFEDVRELGSGGAGFSWVWIVVAGVSGLIGVLAGAFIVRRHMGRKQAT